MVRIDRGLGGRVQAIDRARYYALVLLAGNWRVDTDSAWSTLETARTLEDPAWPARVLSFGALTFGALLTSAGRFGEACGERPLSETQACALALGFDA